MYGKVHVQNVLITSAAAAAACQNRRCCAFQLQTLL
jgi:hypothetical protein